MKGGWREKVELATKFGLKFVEDDNNTNNYKLEKYGDPAYVRKACEASLERLGVDCIDIYYQHRVDTRVPIEVTVSLSFHLNFGFVPSQIFDSVVLYQQRSVHKIA